MSKPKSPGQEQENDKTQALSLLNRLIRAAEDSKPGFEFDQSDDLFKNLNEILQKRLGYRIGIGGRTRVSKRGETTHAADFLLSHPDGRSQSVRLYEFDGPAFLSPMRDGENAFRQREHEIEIAEHWAVHENQVRRHITTQADRDRILSWLNHWRTELQPAGAVATPQDPNYITKSVAMKMFHVSDSTLKRIRNNGVRARRPENAGKTASWEFCEEDLAKRYERRQ